MVPKTSNDREFKIESKSITQTSVTYREGIEMPSRAPLLALVDNESSGFPVLERCMRALIQICVIRVNYCF
jgi:hypothetical protein